MSCSLYPMKISGFFDQKSSHLRNVIFYPVRGKESYACEVASTEIISKLNELGRIHPQLMAAVMDFTASALLSEKNLGYCFGQATERGIEYFNPFGGGKVFKSEEHVNAVFNLGFYQRYNILVEDWTTIGKMLTDEEATKLISEKTGRKATVKTGKRLRRIKELHPSIYDWWKMVHSIKD